MGRFSRYPAINREPVEEAPVGAAVEAPVEEASVEAPAEAAPSAPEPEVEVEVEEVVTVADDAEAEVPDLDEDIDALTSKEVLRWVGDDPARRAYALESEASGKARKTLLRKLRGA
jgi:hypothetical protein